MKTYDYIRLEFDEHKKLVNWLMLGGLALLVIGFVIFFYTESTIGICTSMVGPLLIVMGLKPLIELKRYKDLTPAQVKVDEKGISINGAKRAEVNRAVAWVDVSDASQQRTKLTESSLLLDSLMMIVYGTTKASDVGVRDFLVLRPKSGEPVIVWDRFELYQEIVETASENLKTFNVTVKDKRE